MFATSSINCDANTQVLTILFNELLYLVTMVIDSVCGKRETIRVEPMMISTEKLLLNIIANSIDKINFQEWLTTYTIVAMISSKKEADRSAENYRNTKELLNKIENKSVLIDRAVQVQQAQLVQIINKALDKIGQSPIELQPITEEDINALFEEKMKYGN